MTNQTTINSPVSVTAMGFGRNMRAYPRRIEHDGMTYSFTDAGLRTVINTGGRIAQVLTMSDGLRNFCLRSYNNGGSWTLLSIQS
jgi:hypothetical protein